MTKIKPLTVFRSVASRLDARNIDTFGTNRDGEPADFGSLYGDRLEVIIPDPTPSQRAEYDMPKRGDWDDCERGADEYRDSFFPMMNSLWPVELAYNRSEVRSGRADEPPCGLTSLITIDGDHYIAMTGGGMDLSWHIAAAYVCCGCVPAPLHPAQPVRVAFRDSKARTCGHPRRGPCRCSLSAPRGSEAHAGRARPVQAREGGPADARPHLRRRNRRFHPFLRF